MIFKIMGSAVALAGAVLSAGAVVSAEKRRAEQLSAFASLTELMGRRIEAFSSSVSEILSSADPSLLSGCGSSDPDSRDFGKFLEGCELALSDREKRMLFAFSGELGRKFKDEQVRSCAYYSAELRELAREASEQLPKKRKLTYTLFVCAALALIIILI